MATGILSDSASHQTQSQSQSQSQRSQYLLSEADRQAIKALAPCPEGFVERQRIEFAKNNGGSSF